MLDIQRITSDTLSKVADFIMTGTKDGSLKKALDVSTGLVGYNLKQPAEQLVPLQSPFARTIPRIVKPGANADNWRQITSLGSPDPFTSERAAGSRFATTLASATATFQPVAIRGDVTREAVAASEGFDPALAKETANSLLVAKKLEEQAFLFGTATDLGTVTGLAIADRAGKGTIAAGAGTTYFLRVRALTGLAMNRLAQDIPAGYDGTDALVPGRSITSVNPLLDDAGASITVGCGISADSAEVNSGSLTGAGHGLKCTWTAVPGAAGYVLFVGTTTGAANCKAEVVVGQTSVTLTSLAGTGLADNSATLPAADETGNSKHYPGILYNLAVGAGAGYVKNLAGTLTGTAAGGEITQIQDAFATLWTTAKVGKFRVLVSGVESRTLTKLGVVSSAMQLFSGPMGNDRLLYTAGAHIGEIINATTGDRCPVEVLPWLPAGTIIILPTEIPYPQANLAAPFIWVGNYDWERWDYASTSTTGPIYTFDVRCNGALENHFPGGCGVIYNVFNV